MSGISKKKIQGWLASSHLNLVVCKASLFITKHIGEYNRQRADIVFLQSLTFCASLKTFQYSFANLQLHC